MDLTTLVAGAGTLAPLPGGAATRYAHLDHAASTPPFTAVLDAVAAFAPWYANVHRGRGLTSQRSTRAFDAARDAVLRFVGADPAHAVAVFTRNATESLNHAACRLAVAPGHVVVTTAMEHHSNDLPWRRVAPLVRVGLDPGGRVDEDALRDALRVHRGRVAALAVTAASNVTGYVTPVHRWAAWAHEAGAIVVVDAAQLVGHRPLDVRSPGDPGHLDLVAFSAHKMYAPFGTGVLVGPRAMFAAGEPRLAGGGTVDVVDTDRVVWTAPPEREEAGTPCVVGAVALAAAIERLGSLGWEAVAAHETALTADALARLGRVPGLRLYGDPWPARAGGRLGVVAFTMEGLPHALVAAILADEWGIGTRSGCFCAHPYVKALLGLDGGAMRAMEARIAAGDRRGLPGMVRASVGLANRPGDAALLAEGLEAIAAGRYRAGYAEDRASGEFIHPDSAATAAGAA